MKIKIAGVEEELIKETLENGLEIYLLPNEHVKNYYATFNTKFGSLHTQFKKENASSYVKIPNGVAHFLEHLTFYMENEDASTHYADMGAMSNAYTNFDVTCYEVFGYNRFKENIEYLLDFVQTPFYNAKMVDEEKGIITEEVKMIEDNPDMQLAFALYRNLFEKDHHRFLIAGEVEDVKKTTLKDIENAYKTFYHPSNMFVIITGNFNAEEALAIITENQAKKKFTSPFKIKIKEAKEPVKVVKEFESIETTVEIPKVNIGLKIPKAYFKNSGLSEMEINLYMSFIINTNFGVSSEIREQLITGNIMTEGIYFSKFMTKDYYILELTAETSYPERFISIMKEKLKKLTITKEEFNRKKKVAISNFILSFDNIEEMNASIQMDLLSFGKFQNTIYEQYKNLQFEECKEVAKKIAGKNMSIVVLRPKDEKCEKIEAEDE